MIVWNDIEHLTKNYNSGLKKLDGLNSSIKHNTNKTNHKNNSFQFNHLNDDYGLDERITIKPFHIKYNSNLNKLMSGKSTPSKTLGKHSLSTGTIEAIKLTKKLIPEIDYSYTDPQYYQHNLKNKSNIDFILKEMTPKDLAPGRDFAQRYVATLPKRDALLASISKSSPTSTSSTTLPSSPPPTPSTSTRLNNLPDPNIGVLDNETTTKMQKRWFGNRTNQTLTIGSALPNNENISFEPDINNALNKINWINSCRKTTNN